jgi:glutathione synthase/RimK-type ligase-like ATP-grasp enzyme
VIAKRSGSANGRHVFLLKSNQTPPQLRSNLHFYIYQEYVPTLMSQGELRIFIVNGDTVVHRIATVPPESQDGDLTFWKVRSLHPLSTWKNNK